MIFCNYILRMLFLITCNNALISCDYTLYKHLIWPKVAPLQEVLQQNSHVAYKKVLDKVPFSYSEFSVCSLFPHAGVFDELFVLNIPQGRVQGLCGNIVINNTLPIEMVRANRYDCVLLPKLHNASFAKIPGKVAVIAQHGAGQFWANYYHALYEVFGRLALLEMSGIEYDWLYIPIDKKFVREILELWGIDFAKIISPDSEYFAVQADELIVPSLVINTDAGHKHNGDFQHPVLMSYIKEKLLKAALSKDIAISNFAKNIFISRQDSYNARRISNEDEIFELFEKRGFEKYTLSDLSVTEQILLFYNADIIVSEHSAGLANLLFCRPNTKVVEIFQALIASHYWWIANVLKLHYVPIKTLEISDMNYFANWWDNGIDRLEKAGKSIVNVPLDSIQLCLKNL